ncbi:hypothetical protein K440DRAFT_623319 [Wilcoxina mikolae CBS 423.85]|nr:hypothetical protein K440DRAFT_623319 [Wilcoxina mikolae CBS 423.85]
MNPSVPKESSADSTSSAARCAELVECHGFFKGGTSNRPSQPRSGRREEATRNSSRNQSGSSNHGEGENRVEENRVEENRVEENRVEGRCIVHSMFVRPVMTQVPPAYRTCRDCYMS